MRQEITLTLCSYDPAGTVEVGFLWNETAGSIVFPSVEALEQSNQDLLSTSDEAVRWLLFYLLAKGIRPDELDSQVGRKLVIDVRPAVQQTIALV